MANITHAAFNAEDRSYFSILKREIRHFVTNAGFSTNKIAQIDIIVAEIASNLTKHATGGEILVRLVPDNTENCVFEIISIDNGPGMADPAAMTIDGVSTAKSLGHGLGAIKRLSSYFELYSQKGWGTILLSRVNKLDNLDLRVAPYASLGSIVAPKPGEIVSGDDAYYHHFAGHLITFLGDGLGHGEQANIAIKKSIAALTASKEVIPAYILRSLHAVLKNTRGIVGTVAVYNFKLKSWHFCGVGNIAFSTHTTMQSKNYLSHNGILGLNIPTVLKEQTIENELGQIMIMCSDGIKTRIDLQKFPGIFRCDVAILGAAIYKDYAKKNDDMSILTCRINN